MIGCININGNTVSNYQGLYSGYDKPKGLIGIGNYRNDFYVAVNGEMLTTGNDYGQCVIFAVKGKTKKLKGIYNESDLLLLQKQDSHSTPNIRYRVGYAYRNGNTSERQRFFTPIRTATSAVRSLMSADNFNRFVSSNSSYTFWCICRTKTTSGSYLTAIYCDDITQLKRINTVTEVENSDIDELAIGHSFVSSNSNSKNNCVEQGGFFLNAGYYELNSNKITTTVIDYPGRYIGVNKPDSFGKIKYSNISNDTTDLGYYDYIYELYSGEGSGMNADDVIHYREISGTGSGGGSGSSGGGSVKTDLNNFKIPIDIEWGRNAFSVSSNYISDFKDWKLHFIPLKGRENAYNLNKNILDIGYKDSFNGSENIDILKPLIKLNTIEIDTEELCQIIDDAIAKSLNNESKTTDKRQMLSYIVEIVDKTNNKKTITLSEYFNENKRDENTGKYNFIYKELVSNSGTYSYNETTSIDFVSFIDGISDDLINLEQCELSVDLSLEQERNVLNLYSLELFEAYTRGRDFIQENYTIVRPEERDPDDPDNETSRIMDYNDNYFTYKYSGRNIDLFMGNSDNKNILINGQYTEDYEDNPIYCAAAHNCDILLESDVTLGETYEEQKYFIEAIKVPQWESNNSEIKEPNGKYSYKDTFKVSDYLDIDNGGFDSTIYADDDVEVVTANIDLLQCEYYKPLNATYENNWCDCAARLDNNGKPNVECVYQKLGYCPYRFETEKHPRRIRTLQQSKSNRFNLIQELSKVFEFYPYFYIEHDKNGKVLLDDNGNMKKHVFFMTEKGSEQKMGFRYEKNLKNITRTLDSSSITTKLFVESIDSQYTDDGLCSIQTAIDNIGRTSYILDFSYYAQIGNLDAEQLQRDIYGIENGDFAFLPRIGKYNKQYDDYSNLIITMTGETLTELEAEIEVSTTGITTALEERKKVGQTMYQFKKVSETIKVPEGSLTTTVTKKYSYTTSDTYKNYIVKYREQASIIWGLVEQLFFSGNYFSVPIELKDETGNSIYKFITLDYTKTYSDTDKELMDKIPIADFFDMFNSYKDKYCKGELFWRLLIEGFNDEEEYTPPFNYWQDFKEKIVDTKLYETNGLLGKYKGLYNEVKYWKTERAKILNKINDLSEQFYKKYEPYIKEGTFSDSNYLTDNEYYWAGVQVLKDSSKPKVTYTIDVTDISPLPRYQDDYNFDLADTTFIEDIDFFGINPHTGLPNREKVIISEISENPDQPINNSITLQNYSSQFEDLFESITASVQSLTFNENVYKRASNFTALQYVETDSLQSTLDIGDLTLLDTPKENIKLDESGTEGNDINNTASQYKITGEGVMFSTDGGETWDYGVGPKGLNMDYAKFGSLDASKVQIVDGEYIYFLWDKDGINAYRDPSTSTEGLVDFARFNKYGLSLIEGNNIRLRAGYEFLSNADGNNTTGNYNSELPLTNQNIGFYLYNDSGQPIFKTETRSDYAEDEEADYTARLSLTGEMFITNKVLDSRKFNTTIVNESVIRLSTRYNFFTSYVPNYIYNTYTDILAYMFEKDINTIGVVNSNTYYENIEMEKINTDLDYDVFSPSLPQDSSLTIYHINYNKVNEGELTTVILQEYQLVNFFQIITEKDSISESNIVISMDDLYEAIYNGDSTAERLNSEIFDSNSILSLSYQDNYATNDYVYKGQYSGYRTENRSILKLLSISDSAEIEVSSSTQIQEMSITYLDSDNSQKTQNLYVLGSGNSISYWLNKEDNVSENGIVSSDFSTSEIGVFINNKKALRQQDSDYVDKTNTSSQEITSDMSKEEVTQKLETILSGAERTFMIAAAGEENTNYKCNNILSVLKNGVLYMGGEITDYYGKKLDISSLQYVPDEVRINNPSIMMSNTGQIWCDWNSFYCAYKDVDGTLKYTSYSLMDLINAIEEWSEENSGSSDSTVNQAGYYIDEADVDS